MNVIRYTELDSLRGLAAVTVMVGHFADLWLAASSHSRLYDYLLFPITIGYGGAVMLFFVLSGFVLSLPAVEGSPQPFFTFLIRRICRIYFPYLCAIAIALPGAFWFSHHVRYVDAFQANWPSPLSWQLVRQHVLFIGIFDNTSIDLPVWSLVYEMRISIIFPLVCAVALRLKTGSLWIVAALFSCISIGLARVFRPESDLIYTLHYLAFFMIGIFLARDKKRIGAWMNRQSRSARFWIAMIALLVYWVVGPEIRKIPGLFHFAEWLIVLGACGILLLGMNSEIWKRVLNWPPIRWSGRLSYSIYLLHFIVGLYLTNVLFDKTPFWVSVVIAIPVTLLISEAFYKVIEVPAMNLGRRLGNLYGRNGPSCV